MAPKRGEKREKPEESSKKEEAPAKAQKVKQTDAKQQKNGDSKAAPKQGSKGNASEKVKKLLSDEIQKLAYPEIPPGQGEVDLPDGSQRKAPPKAGSGKKGKAAGAGASKASRSYTSPDLSPFEQLVCAALLSKPISHNLGLRAIQTLLSPPYSLTTPKALADVGNEGRREALWDARTQHKEKTAVQLGNLVEGVRKINGDDDDEEKGIQLSAVRDAAKEAASHSEAIESVRKLLATNIKGVGPTGVDIFLRQVQKQEGWESVFPFVDERGLTLAAQFGLIDEEKDAEKGGKALAELVKNDRVKFVKLLDTLIGLDLEKHSSEVLDRVS